MASTSQKPLPSIPRRTEVPRTLTNLTVEGREHLRRLIHSALAEEDQSFLEDDGRETWANALESALEVLGENIARGGWLTGVKRGRMTRKAKRAEDSKKSEANKAKKEQEDASKLKEKRRDDASAEAPRQQDKELPKMPPSSLTTEQQVDVAGLALRQIRDLTARPAIPTPKPSAKHLLLCVLPIGTTLQTEDSGFDLVPQNVGCTFNPGFFSLPNSDKAESGILFGLDEWDVDIFPLDDDSMRIIGGSFVFKGITSPTEHNTLSKVLRIAIYVHLSLVLEQHFLSDSNVALNLSKPRASPIHPPHFPHPTSDPTPPPPPPSAPKGKFRSSLLPSSIVTFFSRKTESLLQRTAGIAPSLGRSASLDLKPSNSGTLSPLSSEDNALGRLRRLSFIHDNRPPLATPRQKEVNAAADTPFASTLKQLEKSRDILSSSPGVSPALPSLIVTLAAKEAKDPSRHLLADEEAGLKSILGWEGIKAQGKGMVGTLGFVRQQEFSVLHSRHVPSTPSLIPPSSDSSSSSCPDSPLVINPATPVFTPCEKARWITYMYYSRDSRSDKTLGDAIVDLCSAADKPCDKPGCQFIRGEHELRFTHGGLRIVIKVEPQDIRDETSQNDTVEMWVTCKTCTARSRQYPMSEGTYLHSFAKFLELLCYSHAVCILTPTLCEHTTPLQPKLTSDAPLPNSRLQIVRHFSYQSHCVSVSLSAVDDIFELRFPRLQLLSDSGNHSELGSASKGNDTDTDIEKKVLQREIKSWWQGVANHIDKLEQFIQDQPGSFSKSLPRLPSTDDDVDGVDTSATVTPKAHASDLPPKTASTPNELSISSKSTTQKAQALALPPLPPSTPSSSSQQSELSRNIQDQNTSLDAPPPIAKDGGCASSLHRLQNLRHSFQRTEQSLYALLSRTPISSLNDVRMSFLSSSRGATRRLAAWQKKHLSKGPLIVGDLSVQEPEWWSKSCHTIPGRNIIVREDDWGSIIAFTLGSADYQHELAGMSSWRTASSIQPVPSPSQTASTNQSSFFKSNTAYKLFSSSAATPDPDLEGIVWDEPEPYSAVVSRKERDHVSLLSLRDVLRNKIPVEGFNGLSSRSVEGSGSHNVSEVTPPSAWAKPAVEINKHAAGGEISGLPETESAEKPFQEMEAASMVSSQMDSLVSSDMSTSQLGDAHIRRGKASSLLSGDSDLTVGPESITQPPALPPKDIETPSPPEETTSSFFTSSLTNAMRYMLSSGEPSSSFKNQIPGESGHIDDRPHIKYDWMIGKRLKFSCTVYYAKQFEDLRRRCGIEDVFLKSLGRSANWAAMGGKSKSNFWKTSDDRFVIKTLVNAWNVADLSVLIDLAPSYFRYMATTAGEPTVLAKLLGFYTVEIKNLESGNTQAKADLLLMENLFYDQKVGKTFDLKGIQGRKLKSNSGGSGQTPNNKTLFDGEWIEGQQRSLILVRPHSKIVLREAIKNDSDFLSRSNIMDYSLLLGIDEAQKQIACGLVDTIGSYTFAKTLEYKAKQGLNSGKEVTVMPPIEYQERFVKALDGYFVACPDKWSHPLDNTKVINNASLLPCVL